MTRPNILRADTLDLQDSDSPSAQEHSKHPNSHSNAPHVQEKVHHVLEERHSEEQALADAWQISSTLAEDAIATDPAQGNGTTQENATNGASHEGEEGAEGGEHGDDDMMDRISSSPSIDDDLQHKSLEESPSLSSIDSVDLESVLLPVDDPLLDTPLSPNGSAASWESIPDSLLDSRGSQDDLGEDDEHDAFLDLDDRFIDTGWGGECLHDAEDIDFGFVYALHTFVATVEGQANATKGDTMVLLDDSNSYWWLVRVVKDSSIGYLPAEHIETPTERLARLNKHRNIDLSATMLSDNSEKSRNPLKKAMRRRNAKTVQFAAPTYVEASDYDYSTEDEEQMIEPYGDEKPAEDDKKEEPQAEPEEAKKAEPVHPEAERRSSTGSNRASFDREQAATAAQALTEAGLTGDGPKLADKTGEYGHAIDAISRPTVSVEAAPLKSKRTRNTDSFLKDESIETRKITLTPGLLREENASTKSPSSDSTRSNSLDVITKTLSPTEQQPPLSKKDAKKKEKEEKPKKGGMLSGLFKSKKKDKKSKDESGEPDPEKASTELQRESPRASPLPSGTNSPIDKSAISAPMALKNDKQQLAPEETSRDSSKESSEGFVAELEGSAVAHEMATPDQEDSEAQRKIEAQMAQQAQQTQQEKGGLSAITNMLKPADKESKPKKAKRSKERVPMDDFDSPPAEAKDDPMDESESSQERGERLSESPVEISTNTFMHGTESIHIPMPGALPDETDEDDEEPESLTSSPSIIEHPAEPIEEEGELVEDNDPTPTARSPQPFSQEQSKPVSVQPKRGLSTDSSTTSSSSSARPSPRPSPTVSQQAWSDDSLKAWLEDGSEVRDMLVMIHDKSGVKPAPADHPLMSDLFVEQRKGVQNMMGQLDGLLGSYLKRKGVSF
ncbi:Tip elongation aberrant protein Tea4, partial [Pseudocercospora fuligena]